jgi:pyruvate dehydrogenase E1 component
VHRAQRPGIGVGGHISPTRRRRRCTKSASTTSSGPRRPPAATRSSSRVTPPRHLRALLPRGAAVGDQLDGFRQEKSKAPDGIPPTRTRASCRTTGSSRPCRWVSARSTPSTRR